MAKTYLIEFLTIFLILNSQKIVFAQFPQKEIRETAVYSDTLEAIHYGIYLSEINETNKTIEGYTEVKLVSKINNLASIKLEFASLLVDSVFISHVKTLNFTYLRNRIIIKPQTLFHKGDTIIALIYYHGHPFVDPSGWGGFHFAGDYALNLGVGFDAIPHNLGKAWFPCIDDFHDRALYDVYLTVPKDKKAVSGGILIDVTDRGNNTATWHWKTKYTIPTYLISATTGKYEFVQDTFNGLKATVPITIYCRQTDLEKTAGTFINLKNILRVFEDHFGPYPFERIGYTATPGGLGAMEHASNISYPFSGWTGNTDNEWWYAHELSHMWFGDKVTCASAEDMWLNEGWAVWCESLYRLGIYGNQAYKNNMRSKLNEVLQSANVIDGDYYALYGIPQSITYGNTVYQKGGQVVHTLRGYMGDSLFFIGIKAYLQKYAYKYASTYDLRDFLSEFSGIDLGPFFDAWVFSPGFPHFSIDSSVMVKSKNGYDVTVFVRQKRKGTIHYADYNHLEITFMDKNWHSVTDTIVFSGATGSKKFHLPFYPVAVMADMNEKISDATTDEFKTIKTIGQFDYPQSFCKLLVEKINDSALVRITCNWVAPDSLPIQPGLRISDSRYWTIEGIFPSGFAVKGEFAYKKDISHDKSLIPDSNNLLVLLYRPHSGEPWMETSFIRKGSYTEGAFIVDKLQKGEYTFGIWDSKYLNNKEKK